MLKKRCLIKGMVSAILSLAIVITSLASVVSAEEATPTMPDISEYSFITIDEIEPETTVQNLIADMNVSESESVSVYNFEGFELGSNEYVGNDAKVIIKENNAITEVYTVKLYGDINCDGVIAAQDLVKLRKLVFEMYDYDEPVSDITADGDIDIVDLVRLKNYQLGTASIPQKRMAAFSKRFNRLDSVEVPYSISG